jgi:hypothetical protein
VKANGGKIMMGLASANAYSILLHGKRAVSTADTVVASILLATVVMLCAYTLLRECCSKSKRRV